MMIQSGMHGRSINECRSNDCRSNETTPNPHSPLDWGGGGGFYNESLTMDHYGYRAWRVPPPLHAKDIFCRFQNKSRRIFFRPYQTLYTFQRQFKVVDPADPSLVYIIRLVLVLNIAEMLLIGLKE